jgi:N6-L-threonylcarbamoyladenine synthase
MRRGDSLDFSFSGLKTALVYKVRELGPGQALARRADLAASYERAVIGSLIAELGQALKRTGYRRLAIGGGVAANSLLRSRVAEIAGEQGLELKIPPAELCTDNAAMIASAARFVPAVAYPEFLAFDAFARSAA